MKAYRFEFREEIKWEWGFWAFYGFSFLALLVIGNAIDKLFLSWIAIALYVLIFLIITFDVVGYKIRRKK